MGNTDSKGKEAEILSLFTQPEREHLHTVYETIVGNQKCLTEPFLKKFCPKWFDEDLRDILFHVICACDGNRNSSHDNKHISEIHFACFLAQVLKGTYTEKTNILYLLCGGSDGTVLLLDLYKTVSSLIRSYLLVSKTDAGNRTWKTEIKEEHIDRFSRSILGITEEQLLANDETGRDTDQIENWISKCPIFIHMFDRVFMELFPVRTRDSKPKSYIPKVTNVNWSHTSTFLDILSITHINFHLPGPQQSEWRLLYSNSLHGDSFAQLVRFICDKGPSVMVVTDKDGHCFGGYVSESWDIKPQFYGTSDCFLFTLSPRLGVYTATGYNNNFMYLNQGQETLPNGLGLGGQLDYFGLWIDYTFNSGHSKAVPKCTTYGSPQLSAKPDFEVDRIEVWAVGPKKKSDPLSDEEEYMKTSILDKDVGAKAILEMAGKKQHSEGLRDLAEDEGPLSDEMKKKMNTIPKLL